MNHRPAIEALRLYYSWDDDSEMYYRFWRDLYLRVGPDLLTRGQRTVEVATTQGVEPGGLRICGWTQRRTFCLTDMRSVK